MATRSTIALEFADGSVGQVYCHWDGYLEHNGRILLENYQDPFKLQKLIDLGDLSSLGAEVGEKHPFDNPHDYGTDAYNEWRDAMKDVCNFYGRDRGEEGIETNYFKNFADYEKNHGYQEYEYILRQVNGEAVWFVNQGNGYEPLMEAYIEELRQQAEEEETV